MISQGCVIFNLSPHPYHSMFYTDTFSRGRSYWGGFSHATFSPILGSQMQLEQALPDLSVHISWGRNGNQHIFICTLTWSIFRENQGMERIEAEWKAPLPGWAFHVAKWVGVGLMIDLLNTPKNIIWSGFGELYCRCWQINVQRLDNGTYHLYAHLFKPTLILVLSINLNQKGVHGWKCRYVFGDRNVPAMRLISGKWI